MNTDILKKMILKNKKGYYDIAEFCAQENNRLFCRKEKLYICKLSLNKSGYKTDFSLPFDYCKIFGELVDIFKNTGISKINENYLNVKHIPIIHKIIKDGSDELKTFILYNGIKLEQILENKKSMRATRLLEKNKSTEILKKSKSNILL